MSEEILKALTQLFAIITKQDGGVTRTERNFVIDFFQQELDKDSVHSYTRAYDKFSGYDEEKAAMAEVTTVKPRATTVQESLKMLALCKKINQTLTQKQKIVVLTKILELVHSDQKFTPQRLEIVDTIATVFNISKKERVLLELLVKVTGISNLDPEVFLIADSSEPDSGGLKHLNLDLDGHLIFLRIESVELYFLKYEGEDELNLNGFIIPPNKVYLFSHGSTLKTPNGDVLYYSDLVSTYMEELETLRISLEAKIEEYKFPNGFIGLSDVEISEGPGKLIGIMGSSGAGKTTLLNTMAGITRPSKGSITINGFDIYEDRDAIMGVIGYVAQDDLLIEELTVFDNLYFNARLCFADKSDAEIRERVLATLSSLGLDQKKDLKVGSTLNKTISGGQRKRLNIALELIREPAILFVDEPTSGLSSRDSENVMDLLKELSFKGTLIFVVIHQPSSEIYKLFDKMYILDTGGHPIYYGNPIEAITYFKNITNQVDRRRAQCETCGNVNPEQIFNIIEARIVDEYGQFTPKRKVNPTQWNNLFREHYKPEPNRHFEEKPVSNLRIPNKLAQTWIFTLRDTLSKVSNRQYMIINLLEAPLLALILAVVIRYNNSPTGDGYIFRFNDNLPAFILMSIIVALFMGLTVSAEEIIKDRKILRRESFLDLSWNSYLVSKILILFTLSAIQTLSFVLIGNYILEIKGMTLSYWGVLFSVSCFSNLLGLNVSSGLNSAVTVYILIPLLLIPQMILSGLLFNFDKLNEAIASKDKVPILADLMTSRWAFEALAFDQFVNNHFQRPYFRLELEEAHADYTAGYLINGLKNHLLFIENHHDANEEALKSEANQKFEVIKKYLGQETFQGGWEGLNIPESVTLEQLGEYEIAIIRAYLDDLQGHYREKFNDAVSEKEKMMTFFENDPELDYSVNTYKDRYYNESLAELVTNVTDKNRIIETEDEFIRKINPIFYIPENPSGALDYRAHFFAPRKYFAVKYWDTYNFNLAVIWFLSFLLYLLLYFKIFEKTILFFNSMKWKKIKG